MPNRTRIAREPRPRDLWLTPLPHPSWSGDVALPDFAQPLLAADFWKRLGL